MLRINRPIGQQRIAKPTDGSGHDVQLIVNLTISRELFILNNHRHIINAPLLRQQQLANLFIFNQHQSGQAHRHLMTSLPMLMRVEPAGCRALIRCEGHRTFPTRRNNTLRATVDFTGDFQPVPVQRRLFGKLVMDIHRHRLPFTQLDRRPEQTAVISPGRGCFTGKTRLSGLHDQLHTVRGICG